MRRRNKNVSLIYDKNTNIIKVKEKTKNVVYIFLERNKIFFETIVMLIVSIASVIVSIVGINVAMVANKISLNEQKIQDLEKQPSFVLEMEIEDGEEKYIIKNTGGKIKSGNVFGDKILVISVYNESYDYLGKGYIILGEYIEQSFSKYDVENDCFVLRSTIEHKPVLELIEQIENIIQSEGFFSGIECTEYFDFIYIDYKQEMVHRDMILRGGFICDIENNGDFEFKIYLNINDFDEEQIKKEIKEQLDLLVKYNSH